VLAAHSVWLFPDEMVMLEAAGGRLQSIYQGNFSHVQQAEDEHGPPIFPWMDDIDPELETEMLADLATVIIPRSMTGHPE
jgi:hypothetical protein